MPNKLHFSRVAPSVLHFSRDSPNELHFSRVAPSALHFSRASPNELHLSKVSRVLLHPFRAYPIEMRFSRGSPNELQWPPMAQLLPLHRQNSHGRYTCCATLTPACSFRVITNVLEYALVGRCTTKAALIALLVEQSNRMASRPLLLFTPGRLKPYLVLVQARLAGDPALLPVCRESSNMIEGVVNIFGSTSSTISTTTSVFRRHEPMNSLTKQEESDNENWDELTNSQPINSDLLYEVVLLIRDGADQAKNTAKQGPAQNTQILMFQDTVNIFSYTALLERPTSTLPAPPVNSTIPTTNGFFPTPCRHWEADGRGNVWDRILGPRKLALQSD